MQFGTEFGEGKQATGNKIVGAQFSQFYFLHQFAAYFSINCRTGSCAGKQSESTVTPWVDTRRQAVSCVTGELRDRTKQGWEKPEKYPTLQRTAS